MRLARPIRQCLTVVLLIMCGLAVAQDTPASRPTASREAAVTLTKHEGVTFENQTVYISGQAFIGCTFRACTLVLREPAYHLERCEFERCNWHVDTMILWGDSAERLKEIQSLLSMIESASTQPLPSPQKLAQ